MCILEFNILLVTRKFKGIIFCDIAVIEQAGVLIVSDYIK